MCPLCASLVLVLVMHLRCVHRSLLAIPFPSLPGPPKTPISRLEIPVNVPSNLLPLMGLQLLELFGVALRAWSQVAFIIPAISAMCSSFFYLQLRKLFSPFTSRLPAIFRPPAQRPTATSSSSSADVTPDVATAAEVSALEVQLLPFRKLRRLTG